MYKINELIKEKYKEFNITEQANEIREKYSFKHRHFFSILDDMEKNEGVFLSLVISSLFLGLFLFILFSNKGQ